MKTIKMIDILELKSIDSQIKNSLGRLNNRLEIAE